MPKRSTDDNDHTDELPVLLDTVVLDDGRDPPAATLLAENTGQHTALYAMARGHETALASDHAAHTARIAELEADVQGLAGRHRELEQHLAEKEALIGHLKHTIAALRESVKDSGTAERRLAAQLAARDTRLTELTATAERLQREAEARSAQIEQLRSAADQARAEAPGRAEPAIRPAESVPASEVQELREHNATLTAYIAARNAWWVEAEATHSSLAARAAALEHELATSARRLKEADALAAQESNRAMALRAELVDYARRADALERELRLARGTPAATAPPSLVPSASPAAAVPTAAHEPLAGASVGAAARIGSVPPEPAGETANAAAVEDVAHLEAEVEYKRQQVGAQMLELRDRETRLRTLTAELERVRHDLAEARADLDRSREVVGKLERTVIDKDRALAARDARIETLHEELKHRLGALEKLNSIGIPSAGLDSRSATRITSIEQNAETTQAPALICLTDDAPKRFPLTKKIVTVGRGLHCDLQIVTHFVSREHARIYLNGNTALIEDLGSRNGVFVNAVRVDRQPLQQGDLITIGETQFRFVESMAH
jgi:predicted RNase H-like nuclease (RuvC/YqgF family)